MIGLVDIFGFENEPVAYDAEVLLDHKPSIDLMEPAGTVVVSEGDAVVFNFTVADDYGLRKVELVQIYKDKRPAVQATGPIERVITSWEP